MATRSPLARYASLGHEPDEAHARRACRDAWLKDGIVCFDPSWLTHWPDRKQAELIAQKLYGKRRTPS